MKARVSRARVSLEDYTAYHKDPEGAPLHFTVATPFGESMIWPEGEPLFLVSRFGDTVECFKVDLVP